MSAGVAVGGQEIPEHSWVVCMDMLHAGKVLESCSKVGSQRHPSSGKKVFKAWENQREG